VRVLITGYTTRMFGSDRVQGDYITFSYLLEDILKEMGHVVHRRKVVIGEDLDLQYDFAFCGVAPLSSMTSGKVCETHYAMDRMRGRHVVYADDWSFCKYGESVKYALDRWGKYLNYRKFPYSKEVTDDTFDSLERMMAGDKGNNARVLAPMFNWGNHKFLMFENYEAELIPVDPSRWLKYPTVEIPQPKDRIRQWVMAALSNHSSWVNKQGFKLPVKYVGNKRMDNCLILDESSTVRLFANSFGVLSTGYPSAGSGWWRTRYLNAAWAESVIYSDPKDAAVMGKAFQGTAEQFENVQSEREYEMLAESQSSWLQVNLSTKETVKAIFERIMKK
jgi:hypothetical protein